MSAAHVLIRNIASVDLVFGLDWFVLLGGAAHRDVARISRQQKATHVVYAGDHAASVGMTVLRVRRHGTQLYSAAQLVAQTFSQGAVALVVQLDVRQWWLVAVHDGAVIARTDLVCASLAEAQALVGELRQAYPALTLLDDEQKGPSLTDLAGTLHDEARLQRVGFRSRLLSRRWQVLFLMLIAAVVIHRAWGLVAGPDPALSPGPDPAAAWEAAMLDMTRSHWVHGVEGTHDLLRALYGMPTGIAGWRLRQLVCMAERDVWRCHADYDRLAPDADNAGFLSALPDDWTVTFTPLEQARVLWTRPARGLELARTSLRGRRATERDGFSRFQALRPALARIQIEPSVPLRAGPVIGEHGQAVPPPSDLPVYAMRPLRIHAPLRSLSLLVPDSHALGWHRVELNLDPDARPDLIRSRLNVLLQGAIYELD